MKSHVIAVDNYQYELEKNYKDAFQEEDFKERYTEYFHDYDYILGDYSYDKLRLKGFYDKHHKNAKKINTIDGLESYVRDFCSYECRYFLLKKVKK